MLVGKYLHNITETVAELAEIGLIFSYEITADLRTKKIGLIKGIISFADYSKLFFKEYVDLRYKIEKDTYSFHYQDRNGLMIFRYDNALHKPSFGFTEHKHIKDEVVKANVPNIREVLEEIIDEYLNI